MDKLTREMAELYDDGWTPGKIGEKFGMTRQAVRDRFMRAGIKRRRSKFRHIDRENLKEIYSSDQKLTIAEIAEKLSVNRRVIEKALDYHKIPRRKKLSEGGSRIDFLSTLEINEQRLFKYHGKGCPTLHDTAKRIGIRISLRSKGDGNFLVKRIG